MAPSSSATTTSIQVAVRIRPPTTQDTTSIPARFQRAVVHPISQTSVAIDPLTNVAATSSGAAAPPASSTSSAAAQKKQTFTFDQVHTPSSTQHGLFTSTAQPLISRFLEGFNCTILAYGQTSSGKTFTMTGVDLDADPSDPNNGMGIIPRAVHTIFQRARALKEERGNAWNYSLQGSFIELYNEDLIDLLSMDDASGGRRDNVQIREDKGHIIWSGLREVTVKNANEVMNLIRQGAAIRRTNETDMNAQSSRSHAIFSLTLTQKKYTGSAPPPRSSSPLPATGRSPSRLARPGSMYAPAGTRVSSPTFGRPGTPSFVSAMDRSALRPPSSLGHSPAEEAGEWVTVVSKFHFVDLAGSERLKRTAAQGERIKEGISINSGLLALGNVISALGDPARAKTNTASHIPYRDSKLTRLLQDSLGGNAHTLMIACVSPAEWNAAETVNTLKYANRARNIKNRVTINEKEEGWDDVEWLQTTVTRLRKEVRTIKETGGKGGPVSNDSVREVPEGSSKKVLEQMVQLQSNYEDLREKFVDRTEELTRLRRELAEKQRNSSSGAVNGTAKYEEIVGPVIEEYEKTISAMEAELSLNRAALRHTNDLYQEKESELSDIGEKHARTELYVEELKMRVAKLSEREGSTEAYVRDLEEKIKHYDETNTSSSESMTDLKREITRYKDAESHATQYIADLEARLARSDESVHALQQSVDKLEKECERRREEVEVLQSRLETLRNDGDAWRTDLQERESKVKELEIKMQEWEAKKKEAGEERTRLGDMVNEVSNARKSLQLEGWKAPPINGDAKESETDPAVETQLAALQKTHADTLNDLSSVTSKYRDALREISDLAAQIQEAKLSDAPSEPLERSMEIPPFGRRLNTPRSREASESPYSKRFLYRHAASTESLHARSQSQSQPLSQSLSQELSLVKSRKASFSSNPTSSPVSYSPSHARPNLSLSLPMNGAPTPNGQERSVGSLEKEILRLQEVLKDREAEIALLEGSLQAKDKASNDAAGQSPNIPNGHAPKLDLSPKTMSQFNDLRKRISIRIPSDADRVDSISASEADESLERLNELMRSMAQKESWHREVVDSLNIELGQVRSELDQVRRQCDELNTLSRDQAHNMSTELSALAEKHDENAALLEQAQLREVELVESLRQAESDHAAAQSDHAAAVEQLHSEHKDALRVKEEEVDVLLSRMKEGHQTSLKALREQLAEASASLESAHKDHTEAFGKLQADHEEALHRRIDEANASLQRTQQEHESALLKVTADHEQALKKKDEDISATLARTEEEYYDALTKLRADHSQALEKQVTESQAMLERLRDEHASELRQIEITHRGTISDSQSSLDNAMGELKNEYTQTISKKEAQFAEELSKLKSEQSLVLIAREQEYSSAVEKLRSEHARAIDGVQVKLQKDAEDLRAELAKHRLQLASSTKAREDMDVAMTTLKEQQAVILQEVERGHEGEMEKIKAAHKSALQEATLSAEQERSSLSQSHAEVITKLKSEHQNAIAEVQANLVAAEEQHRQSLEDARAQSERLMDEEKARIEALVSEMSENHSRERDTLRKDHDLLVQQLDSYKAANEELKVVLEDASKSQEEVSTRKDGEIGHLQGLLSDSQAERERMKAEMEQLRSELDTTRSQQSQLVQDASKRQSLDDELEKHRSELAEMQESLQRTRDEKDQLLAEKHRHDSVVKDLQTQLAQNASPYDMAARALPERSIAYSRVNGLPPAKLPPSTPPPSIPPPPPPKSASAFSEAFSGSSQSSAITLASSRDSTLDSPSTSVASPSVDASLIGKIEEQAKQIDEQEAMIKTLNKQLMHCETDLQTHMDLVNTLEASLGDSEKNLRKARMHATELARERDTLSSQIDTLRHDLTEARREVVTVRRSVVEEKQSLESRLDEERKAKERARAQLDNRMEELQKRKSKFACL